jgi:hypothetical protein
VTRSEWEELLARKEAEKAAVLPYDIPRWAGLEVELISLRAQFNKRFPRKPSPAPAPPSIGEGAIRKWLSARVASWAAKPYPGEKVDRAAAETALGGRISRDLFRKIRREVLKRSRGRPSLNAPPPEFNSRK